MAEAGQDEWSVWLASRRHGGNAESLRRTMEFLGPIRDQVVSNAAPAPGDTVLDVGCGDGLIAFAAAERVGTAGSVIFADISADLLSLCEERADRLGIAARCEFVQTRASDLRTIGDATVDAVTLRSVLIYESDKASAFAEFFRVLRPGGRLSLFEPINRFINDEGTGCFAGYDVEPVVDLAAKVKAVYDAIQPPESDPMLDFDERDLVRLAERAGFEPVHLRYQVDIYRAEPTRWETAAHIAGNPRIPTMAEAVQQALSPAQVERLTDWLRPQAEQGTRRRRRAVTYLWGVRPSP
ncbi:MAG: methyltransferase domain-containing protein [Streptosporangiales bacterium]|nr:methyltransferase domain-containing protein [Streptosporangiales bacterium]